MKRIHTHALTPFKQTARGEESAWRHQVLSEAPKLMAQINLHFVLHCPVNEALVVIGMGV